jgi:hypothetical protein
MSWWSILWRRPSLAAYADTLQRAATARGLAWHVTRADDAVTITGALPTSQGALYGVITRRSATYTLSGSLSGFTLARAREGDPYADSFITLDSGFDERVLVRGDEVALCAALSAQGRSLLSRAIINHGITLQDGQLLYTQRLTSDSDPAESLALLEALHAALCDPPPHDGGAPAPRRADPDPLSEPPTDALNPWLRVVDNAANDPLPQVRKRCLKLLLTLPERDPLRARALRVAQSDRRPDIALLAAESLGAASIRVPMSIAADPLVSIEQRRQAFAHALHFGDAQQRLRLTRALLSQPATPAPLLRDALLALDIPDASDASDAAAVDDLPHLLHHLEHDDPTVLDALARALRRFPCPDAERALIHIFSLCPHDQPKLSAAQSLGIFGTVAAVPALSAAAQEGSTWRPLRDVARISLQHIRARLLDAGLDAGQLSLADPTDAGQLALADTADPPRT